MKINFTFAFHIFLSFKAQEQPEQERCQTETPQNPNCFAKHTKCRCDKTSSLSAVVVLARRNEFVAAGAELLCQKSVAAALHHILGSVARTENAEVSPSIAVKVSVCRRWRSQLKAGCDINVI